MLRLTRTLGGVCFRSPENETWTCAVCDFQNAAYFNANDLGKQHSETCYNTLPIPSCMRPERRSGNLGLLSISMLSLVCMTAYGLPEFTRPEVEYRTPLSTVTAGKTS